jgi:ribonucleoside-diphosphate reductase alpha chain
LANNHPELVEDDFFKPTIQAVISVPQRAPQGSILRTEDVMDMLERTKKFNVQWVRKGHRKGANTNNVSATVSIKEGEWEQVGQWMWDNKDTFNGLSVLPYFGGSYTQAPFEDITKEQFDEMASHLHNIDLSKIVEFSDDTNLSENLACSGGSCEIV